MTKSMLPFPSYVITPSQPLILFFSIVTIGGDPLRDRFVARVSHVRLAVREEVVDDHSDNGEEEDNETPEDLVGEGAVRLKDLDCGSTG
jgi:hypothetical protein